MTNAGQIAEAIANKQGVTNLSNGVTYDLFTIPTSFTFTSASDNSAGSGSVTQYIFNNSILNAAVTVNGPTPASITNTYGDGFTGLIYQQLMRSANSGRGIFIKGFTVIATNYTSGIQIASALNTINLQMINANGQGGSTPIPLTVSEGVRNTQFQIGTLTIVEGFYLNALNQISFYLPANTTMAFTFFTQASSFNG